jgi:hypothetical protein
MPSWRGAVKNTGKILLLSYLYMIKGTRHSFSALSSYNYALLHQINSSIRNLFLYANDVNFLGDDINIKGTTQRTDKEVSSKVNTSKKSI